MHPDHEPPAAGSESSELGRDAGVAVETRDDVKIRMDDDAPAEGPGPDNSGARTHQDGRDAGASGHEHRRHLVDPQEDRWKWRARIRRNPHQLFLYRIGVVLAGLALMVAAIVTGPVPGPGGIPLFLLGLAVWASEFEWAHRVMLWFKKQLHRYLGWSRGRKVLFWATFLTICGVAWYSSMLVAGIPGWMPAPAENYLTLLPGVD